MWLSTILALAAVPISMMLRSRLILWMDWRTITEQGLPGFKELMSIGAPNAPLVPLLAAPSSGIVPAGAPLVAAEASADVTGVGNCTRWANASPQASAHHTAARPQTIRAVFTTFPFAGWSGCDEIRRAEKDAFHTKPLRAGQERFAQER